MNKLTLVCLITTLSIAACGGSGGSSDSALTPTPEPAPTPEVEISTLPNVTGFDIVSDIINLDLNRDGLEDLVYVRTPEEPYYQGAYFQALINNGDRTFTDQSTTYFPNLTTNWRWIEKVYLVDINGDGHKDIIPHLDMDFESPMPPLIQADDGVFSMANDQVLIDNAGAMLPLDVDKDGDIDIIVRKVANWGDETLQQHQLQLLLNNNNTNFSDAGIVSTDTRMGWNNAAFVYSPVILDINKDSYPDIIYGGARWEGANWVDKRTSMTVFLNNQDNTYYESTNTVFSDPIPSYTLSRELVKADFDSNGEEDILVANTGYDVEPWNGENNGILFNNGAGELKEQRGSIETHDYRGMTHSGDVADIDADGDIDIIYNDILGLDTTNETKIRILKNDGAGNFTNQNFTLPTQYTTDGSWGSTATLLVDLNKDGYPEIVLGGMGADAASLIIWNDGSGHY
ncbi:hypothetical protein CW745_08540 [Psychromonas sp. psych-6C06]|uniref:FG-GAP repeat domain-containing protein n=1 Tax=Psychromonas sp. psych-6C06 TaxID=2058089 RepID=UPI000C31F540|nr:VCBS repeat-containing protein [Psychromonas sp. psych-6C06]PKF62023.1 hypothetical protein CW745_08540 [Psychromonas sp. psych-6C06]